MQINTPYHADTGEEAMMEKISIRRTQKDEEENKRKLGILIEDGKISIRKILKNEEENKKK
jgi:hypothetical protein